jgi:ubiquinone/menaquinone biosynthesis C-methylase UbiE
MIQRFTERDTETYYDGEDAIYRQLWDEDGKVHWGLFDGTTGDDFSKAALNHDLQMVSRGRIDREANVLDVGCGNGTVAMWLSRTVGCRVTGVDLSGVRIENASKARLVQPPELQQRTRFVKASATELPFESGTFSHVWSQACIYHVHDKAKCLREIHRVLADGGIFVFDDLVKPRSDLSSEARKFVYDRLLFDTEYSFGGYQQALESVGFEMLEAENLTEHLCRSYALLADRADQLDGGHRAHFEALALAYRESVEAARRREVAWALFVCRK